MRLEDLTPDHVRRAVGIYMKLAWSERAQTRPVFDPAQLAQAASIEELFALCQKPRQRSDGPLLERYTLRLGNERYPFMKFVIQEYLLEREFFFSVDTHDDLDIGPNNPDYDGWLEVKAFNRQLKLGIEGAWEQAGLPTHRQLRQLAVDLAGEGQPGVERGRILIADDEENVARGLAALFEARGYQVAIALDGRQALELLAHEKLPDLVLLDYAMPEFTGAEVLDRMRADARTRDVLVLLATASDIDLERMGRVSGLLRKPYHHQVLFAMVQKLLAAERG